MHQYSFGQKICSEYSWRPKLRLTLSNSLLGGETQRSEPSSKSSSPDQCYYDVPNRRVRSFVGREDILRKIDDAFSIGEGPRIAVLQGMGGQGKSQVALEYCQRKRNDPYKTIFWVDATTENTTIADFQSIAERLKTPTDNLPNRESRIKFVLHTFYPGLQAGS